MGFGEIFTGNKKLNTKQDAKKSQEQGSIIDRINLADDAKKLEILINPENKQKLIRDLNSKVEGDITLKQSFEKLTKDLISKEKEKFSGDNRKNKITLNSSDLKNIQSILTMNNIFDKKDDGKKSSDYRFFKDLIRIIDSKDNYKNEYVSIDLPDGGKQKFLLTQENGNIVLNNKIEKVSGISLGDHPKDFLFSIEYIGTGYDVLIKDQTSKEKRIHLGEKDKKSGLVELGDPSLVYGWKLENDQISFKSLSSGTIKDYIKKPSQKEEDKTYLTGHESSQPLTEATVGGKIDGAIKSGDTEIIKKYINNPDKKIQQAGANSLNTLLNQTLNNFNAGKFDLAGIAQVFTELFKNSGFKSFLDEWSSIFGTENTLSKNIAKLEQGLSDNEINKSFEKDDPKLKERDQILKSYESEKGKKIFKDLPQGSKLESELGSLEVKLIEGNGIKIGNKLQIGTGALNAKNLRTIDNVDEKTGHISLSRTIVKESSNYREQKFGKNAGEKYKIDTKNKKETFNFNVTKLKEEVASKDQENYANILEKTIESKNENIKKLANTIDITAYINSLKNNSAKFKATKPEEIMSEKTFENLNQALNNGLKISSEKDFLNALTTLLLTGKLGKYYSPVEQSLASK